MAITWTPTIAVGVARIDDQHKQLIEAINNLHQALLRREAKHTLSGLVDYLRRYTAEHFRAEERAMAASAFPRLEMHRRDHQKFTMDVSRFEKSLAMNGPTRELADELSSVLTIWFFGHIKSLDVELGKHLESTGLQIDEIAVQPFARA